MSIPQVRGRQSPPHLTAPQPQARRPRPRPRLGFTLRPHPYFYPYPFRGIVYFLRHPALYPLLRARLLPCALLSAFVLTLLFTFTYLPQVAFLALFHPTRGLPWFSGSVLVLGEGSLVVAVLWEAFFVDEACVDVFDAVLILRNHEDLLSPYRTIHPPSGDNPTSPLPRLGPIPSRSPNTYSPFSLRQIVEFTLLLPLNLIPVVGVPLFLVLTGYRAGPLHHHRYFQLRGMGKKERKESVKRRRGGYILFGTIGLVLQLVPVASMFFLMTTAAGSALWAADLEEKKMAREGIVDDGHDGRGAGEGAYRDDFDPNDGLDVGVTSPV